jgi:hypothetical protein
MLVAEQVIIAVISYNIACKYWIYFLTRIAAGEAHLCPELPAMLLVWLVPKFYLAAHIPACVDDHSFNTTKNVGRTCGEQVKMLWASLNGLATSMQEMGVGMQRDTLSDNMNDSNWHKMTCEGTFHPNPSLTPNTDAGYLY